MTNAITSNPSPVVLAQKQVRSTIENASANISRGNTLNYSAETKDTDLRNHSNAIINLGKNEALAEYSQQKLAPMGNQLEQLNDIILGMDNIGAIIKGNVTLDTDTRMAALTEARTSLQKISNLLSRFPNVDYHSIVNNPNVNNDGSYNTNYINTPTPNQFVEVLDGHTQQETLVPEVFKDIIGAFNSVIESTSLPNSTNISPEARAAFTDGVNSLLQIQSSTRANYEALDKVYEESNLRAGENLDAIKQNEELKQEELAQKLQEAQVNLNLLRNLEMYAYRLENQLISMASAIG